MLINQSLLPVVILSGSVVAMAVELIPSRLNDNLTMPLFWINYDVFRDCFVTFLSPSILWLIGAIGIPIAIHIFSLMRVDKVEFSSIRFIKELKTSSIRKIRNQKLLLLLLRILIIVCLVMMMAHL